MELIRTFYSLLAKEIKDLRQGRDARLRRLCNNPRIILAFAALVQARFEICDNACDNHVPMPGVKAP